MKNLLLILSVFCCISLSLFGNLCNTFSSDEVKVYVPASSISIDNEQIHIIDGSGAIPVNALHCDADGIYVILPQTREINTRCPNNHNVVCSCRGCYTRRGLKL